MKISLAPPTTDRIPDNDDAFVADAAPAAVSTCNIPLCGSSMVEAEVEFVVLTLEVRFDAFPLGKREFTETRGPEPKERRWGSVDIANVDDKYDNNMNNEEQESWLIKDKINNEKNALSVGSEREENERETSAGEEPINTNNKY